MVTLYGMVAQWLVVPPHSNNIQGSMPGAGVLHFCVGFRP